MVAPHLNAFLSFGSKLLYPVSLVLSRFKYCVIEYCGLNCIQEEVFVLW